MTVQRQSHPRPKFQWENLPNIERTRIMDILIKHNVSWSPIFSFSVTLKPTENLLYYTVGLFNDVKIFYKAPWNHEQNPMENPELVYTGEWVTAEFVKEQALPMFKDRTFIIDTNVVIFTGLREVKSNEKGGEV